MDAKKICYEYDPSKFTSRNDNSKWFNENLSPCARPKWANGRYMFQLKDQEDVSSKEAQAHSMDNSNQISHSNTGMTTGKLKLI